MPVLLLLKQIRAGNSFLKCDSFKNGHADSNVFIRAQIEDSKHYFTKCNLYTVHRQKLISQMEQFIPNFSLLAAKRQLEIIMMGFEYKNPAYGRQRISRPMQIVGPIQFWRGCVIYFRKMK